MKALLSSFVVKIFLYIRKIDFGDGLKCVGIPYIRSKGNLTLGHSITINSGLKANPVFGFECCTIICTKFAEIIIGNNVGMSNVTIYSHNSITIGHYTLLGAGVKIWDTDFHSLDASTRLLSSDKGLSSPITIGENCFIGAGSLILKGVSIGDNAVVGAGSVVTKDIPQNQIWAGNPAKYIREIK